MTPNNSAKTISRKRGKVSWFNEAKGFGFILPEDGSDEVFVHHTYIVTDDYPVLADGQHVEFDVIRRGAAFQATSVRTL